MLLLNPEQSPHPNSTSKTAQYYIANTFMISRGTCWTCQNYHTCSKRTKCEQVIAANKGSTMTGTKCRVCMIELFLHLLRQPVSSEILLLVETAVRISELLYMHDSNRNLRNILQLYNCVWIHHELCSKLITTFHSGMSYNKLFGTYTYMHLWHMHHNSSRLYRYIQWTLKIKSVYLSKRGVQQLQQATDILAMCWPPQSFGYRPRLHLRI